MAPITGDHIAMYDNVRGPAVSRWISRFLWLANNCQFYHFTVSNLFPITSVEKIIDFLFHPSEVFENKMIVWFEAFLQKFSVIIAYSAATQLIIKTSHLMS